ncbi:MAG: amidohydrolase [Candidatus Rokubacteria bacterium]|nr:amidohydrolase [Candidatus Rokubacteria bacterium]
MSATIIRGGRVLDVTGDRAEPADVLVDGGVIRDIGRPGTAAPEGAAVLDARDRLLIPGLVNAHTHAHGALARGLPGDRVPLEMLLTTGAALGGSRGLEDKYLSAQLSAIEMVRKGCTACYDLFVEYPTPTVDGTYAVARAYRDVGMRAVVAPMMADRTLFQALPGLLDALPEAERQRVDALRTSPYEASAAACRDILRDWPFDRARVRPALGPTIPLHCSDEFLTACRDLAREYDVPLQTHLAESRGQAVLGLRKYGKTLTAHLADLGLLGPRFSGAHGVWLDADDVRRLADAGASVAHNPMSNLRLGSGVAATRLMLDGGLRVGVGTDSASSSDSQNMFEALRWASYLSRIGTLDYRRWLSAPEAFTMATTGSAAVLGMQGQIGRLAPGYRADIVLLDLTRPEYVPLNDVLLQLVFAEGGASVDSVMIDGRVVLDRGRLLTVDEAKVRASAEAAAARLREANAGAVAAARALEDYVGAFCVGLAREPYRVARVLALDA